MLAKALKSAQPDNGARAACHAIDHLHEVACAQQTAWRTDKDNVTLVELGSSETQPVDIPLLARHFVNDASPPDDTG